MSHADVNAYKTAHPHSLGRPGEALHVPETRAQGDQRDAELHMVMKARRLSLAKDGVDQPCSFLDDVRASSCGSGIKG